MITRQKLKIYNRVIERLGGVDKNGRKIKPEDIDLVFMSQFDLVSKMMDEPETSSIILPGFGVWNLRRRVKHARDAYYKLKNREDMTFKDVCDFCYRQNPVKK